VAGATGVDSRAGAAVILERAASGAWQPRNTVVNEMRGYEAITGEEVLCTDDEAAGFECSNVDVVSFLPIKDIGGARGTRVNDIWGWTDPESAREYAIVGRTDGTSFVDISDPSRPVYLGDLPKTEGSRSSIWRDMKVYRDHVYIVADAANEHGVQVFDLRQLRTVRNPPVTFEETFIYDGIHSAHNIVINEESGYAYSVGSSSGGETCGGGLHMISLEDPGRPTFAGCFADPSTGRRKTGYSHDAQCVVYHGPDAEHRSKEICLGSNETALNIADVSDKDNPVSIATISYPNVAYTHQGWLSEDHRYFYQNDEGDEPQGLVAGTRTLVWDVTDLDDPVLVKEHIAATTTTDHNLYVRGNLMYQSNYGSGLRILDISEPDNPVEIGFFDSTPYGGSGSWSNYPYFPSGTIVFTSGSEGLFVVKSRGRMALIPDAER
jgi:choice-of-anchor B domain-containing protein